MANDFQVNAPTSSGVTIAADDISNVWWQKVKLAYGGEDSATEVSDVNPLPIDDAGGSVTVDAPTGTPVQVQIGDGTDQALVSAGGALQVDVASALPTGANTIGDVTVSGDALTALQKVDNIAHTGSDVALSDHVPISGQLDDTATTTVTENQVAPVRITSDRALHVAQQGTVTVSDDGSFVVDLGANNDITVEGGAVLGTDGVAGPANALSVGGTQSDGTFEELRVDTDGHLQVDILSGGGGPEDTDDDVVAGGQTAALGIALTYGWDGTQWERVATDASGSLDVNITADGAGLALAANQLADGHNVTVDNAAGASAVNIQDGGNSITVDSAGGDLDVNINADAVGLATSANQPAVYVDDTSVHSGTSEGNLLMAAATPTDTAVDANDIGAVAMSVDRRLHVDSDIVAQSVGNLNVNVAADAVGLATSANQLPDGHNVTIDNAAGASAVNIQDGGNDISVDWAGTAPPIGAGTEAAALRVTLATNSTGLVSVDDNGGNLSIDFAGTAPTLNTGTVDAGTLRVTVATDDTVTVDNGGTFATQATLQAGSALVGDVGISGARTSGGTTPHYNDGVATETEVKGSGGQIYWISAINLASTVVYLQLFNNTAAAVTPGTTTPTNEFPIPTQGDTNGAGFNIAIPNGLAYGTGITYFISTAKGGGTATSADNVLLNLGYA